MLDKKYDFATSQEKWINYWKENETYKYIKGKKPVFSIDTPPPTVNGKIHIGHIFSYTQTEMIARYKRLQGYNIFYPFGFDDNGLPTERLVEKEQGKKAHQIGREEFTKLCIETTDKYEKEFKELFTKMAVSTDWSLAYKTISPDSVRVSQQTFIQMAKDNHAYHKEAPALWCNECITSIAQAELETKTVKSTFNYLTFSTTDGEDFQIATTRPELLPAIVAVFVNKDDEKTNHLIGKIAKVPFVDREVPILADEAVEIGKGTGAVMCCTFGDQTDIAWVRKYNLPIIDIFTKYGTIKEEIPVIGGMKIKAAREEILNVLDELGALVKREDLSHEVQTHERCGKEVEYTIIDQWFIDTISIKDKLLEIGDQINWYPAHMKTRYTQWVENVLWDWCISRQRYFGVPFPVWYCKECRTPYFANENDLPVNPLVDKCPVEKCTCGCSEFEGEKDIMDTWATSSGTPLINARYKLEGQNDDILPFSLRTNASEIIRTWDFYTIVKMHYILGIKPWENLAISGFVMANKGEKISKSKGNSKHDPVELLKQEPVDSIRYWAGTGKMGMDIVFADETLKRGRKLLNKIFNLSKFILMHLEDYKDMQEKYDKDYAKIEDFELIDMQTLLAFAQCEKQYVAYNEEYEVGLALNTLEKFFWNFCDNYIEIVKHRLYRPEEFGYKQRFSAQKTCYYILYKFLQDFSIYMPYITEEVYQAIYKDDFGFDSIHTSKFEDIFTLANIQKDNLDNLLKDQKKLTSDIEYIVSALRGEKTKANVSLKTPFEFVTIYANKELQDAILSAKPDLCASLFINELVLKDIEDAKELIETVKEQLVEDGQEQEQQEKTNKDIYIESKLILEEN